MEFGIQNKVALIGAGSQGIGLAVVEALLSEGCAVSFCSRSKDHVMQAERKLNERFPHARIFASAADLGDARAVDGWVDATQKELGSVEILVTNSGGPPVGGILDVSEEQWKLGFEATVLNASRLVGRVAPAMRSRGWGRIVHVTSLVAREPSPVLAISSTLRMGIRAMTCLQAKALAASGVTVNAVLPGHTLTARQEELIRLEAQRAGVSLEKMTEQKMQRLPMKRAARPDEVANVVAFLCSNSASYVSGESILVDGASTSSP